MAKAKIGRPKTRTHNPVKASAKNTKQGEEKYIVIMKTEDVEAAKNLAYWERLTIKEVFANALADYKARYEKKNGPLKSRPK